MGGRARGGPGRSGGAPRPCRWPCRPRSGSPRAQPLQARQRSSASWTSGEARPRTRAAVDRLLEHPAASPGGVLLVPGGQPGRAHHPAGAGAVGHAAPDPGAAVHGAGQVAAVLRIAEPEPPGDRPGHGAAQVGVEGARAHQHPRVEQVARVEDGLDGGHGLDRGRLVHPGEQLGAGAPVAVLARHRAAVGGDQLGRLLDERPVDRPPVGPVEREVDAHVQAAVAEVAVGDAAQPVGGQQGLEVAQVGAEPLGRDGRVLPAGPGRRPGRAAPAEPGPVLADAPDGGRLGRVGEDPAGQRVAAGLGDQPAGGRLGLGRGRAGQLDQQPAAPLGQLRHGPAPAPDHLDDAGVDALAGPPAAAAGPCRRRRPPWPCPGSRARPARPRPGPGPAGRWPARTTARVPSLPARARARSPPRSGQQVLQLVAGVLAGEAAELGPDGGQVGPDHLLQPRDGGGAARAGPQALAGATDHLQLQDVVGGAAVGQGPRPAGVVADHPAEGAAAVGRRVGPEAQPVGPGRRLEVVEHHARLDRGRGRLRVQRQHPPEVPAQVHDHAGTDGVAGDRGAGAPGRQRDAQLEAGGDDGLDLVGVAREGDQLGRHPVQRGVGRVLGPPPRGRVDLGHPGPPQGRGQLGGQVPDPSPSETPPDGAAGGGSPARSGDRLEPALVGEDGRRSAASSGLRASRSRRASAVRRRWVT